MQFDYASTHSYFEEEIPEVLDEFKKKSNSLLILEPSKNGEKRCLAKVEFNKKPAYFHKGYAKIQNAKFFDTIRYLLDKGGAKYTIRFPKIFIWDFGKYEDADGLEVAIGLITAVELLIGIHDGKREM